jgi:hypothetical protein
MQAFRALLLVMMAAALGCAGAPARLELPQGARIGILNLLEPEITHIHIGSLRFDGFTNSIEVDWDIPGFIARRIEADLRAQGRHTLIPLAADAAADWRQAMSRAVVRSVGWRMAGELRGFVETAAAEQQLDAVITVSSFNSNARPQEGCFAIGKEEVVTRGYGLFTWQRALSRVSERLPFGQNIASPFAHIMVAVFHAKPAALAGFGEAPCSNVTLQGFPWEGDLRRLSPEVMRELRPQIEQLAADAARAGLRRSGLVQ